MKFKWLLQGMICSCLFFGLSSAAMEEDLQVHTVSITATLLASPESVESIQDGKSVVFVDIMGEYHELELSPYNLSTVLQYQGPREIVFYATRPSDAEDRPEVRGTALIPRAASEVILLFVEPSIPGDRYRIIALDNSLDRIPVDSLRLINMTSQLLAYDISGEFGKLQPGENTIYRYDQGGDYARIKLAYQSDDISWRLGISRYQQLITGRRTTYLLLPNAHKDTQGFVIRVLTDSAAR